MGEIASNIPFDILITNNSRRPNNHSSFTFRPRPQLLKPSLLPNSLSLYAMALLKSFILALSAVTAVTAAPILETRENTEAPMYSGTWDQFPGNETWLAFEDLVRTPLS